MLEVIYICRFPITDQAFNYIDVFNKLEILPFPWANIAILFDDLAKFDVCLRSLFCLNAPSLKRVAVDFKAKLKNWCKSFSFIIS